MDLNLSFKLVNIVLGLITFLIGLKVINPFRKKNKPEKEKLWYKKFGLLLKIAGISIIVINPTQLFFLTAKKRVSINQKKKNNNWILFESNSGRSKWLTHDQGLESTESGNYFSYYSNGLVMENWKIADNKLAEYIQVDLQGKTVLSKNDSGYTYIPDGKYMLYHPM